MIDLGDLHIVPSALLERVVDAHVCEPVTAPRPVHGRDPVVRPPVGERAWVVETEYVDVCAMHKVVGEDGGVSANVTGADDAEVRRVVLGEPGDERLRPPRGQQVRVIVDAVVVHHVVDVRLHHGVVLRPGRPTRVFTLDVVQRHVEMRGALLRAHLAEGTVERVEVGDDSEERVALIVRQVDVVVIATTRRAAERWHERAKKRKPVPHVAGCDISKGAWRYRASYRYGWVVVCDNVRVVMFLVQQNVVIVHVIPQLGRVTERLVVNVDVRFLPTTAVVTQGEPTQRPVRLTEGQL